MIGLPLYNTPSMIEYQMMPKLCWYQLREPLTIVEAENSKTLLKMSYAGQVSSPDEQLYPKLRYYLVMDNITHIPASLASR